MGGEQTADEVFQLLSNEIRLDILRAVAVAQREHRRTGVTELTFSDLYDRVDVDDTSKLSYHLGELTGTFLRKHEDGYAFTHAGEQLVRFVLAENYRRPAEVGPVETEGRCLFCGETTLLASLHDQYFTIRCSACDRPAYAYRVRPAQVRSHTGADLLESVIREQAGDLLKARQGVCPDCAGALDTTVLDADSEVTPDGVPVAYATASECQECLRFVSLPLTHAAVFHPESIAFYWEHGVDVLGTGLWEFHRYLEEGLWTVDRTSTDPVEYRVEFDHKTSSLRVFLDDSAAVTRTERVRRTDQSDLGS
jgi:hypothetical protein